MKKSLIFLFTLIVCYYHYSYVPKCNGIDISHHNMLNWDSLDKNIEFCYIKATEGKSFKDSMCGTHATEAKKRNMCVGLYHYFRTDVSPEEQFHNFKTIASEIDFNLIPAIDVEENGNDFSNKEQVNKNLAKLIQLFEEEYGQKPLIYLGSWCCTKVLGVVYDCPIWLRFIKCYNFIPNTAVKQFAVIDNLDRNYCKNVNKCAYTI